MQIDVPPGTLLVDAITPCQRQPDFWPADRSQLFCHILLNWQPSHFQFYRTIFHWGPAKFKIILQIIHPGSYTPIVVGWQFLFRNFFLVKFSHKKICLMRGREAKSHLISKCVYHSAVQWGLMGCSVHNSACFPSGTVGARPGQARPTQLPWSTER